jgi:hypothetical protein
MAPRNKGLTSAYPLKMTAEERALLENVQRVYGVEGVEMSLNDTIRHLIRRGGIVLAHTVEGAQDAIRKHCKTCEHCELEPWKLGCPDGLYLHRSYRRIQRAHAGTGTGSAL